MRLQNYNDFYDGRLMSLEKSLETKFPLKHLNEIKLQILELEFGQGYTGKGNFYKGVNIGRKIQISRELEGWAKCWRFICLKNDRDTCYFLAATKDLGHHEFLMGLFVENGEGNISHFKLYSTDTDNLDEMIKYYDSVAKRTP
jgi:hypothetical protein